MAPTGVRPESERRDYRILDLFRIFYFFWGCPVFLEWLTNLVNGRQLHHHFLGAYKGGVQTFPIYTTT